MTIATEPGSGALPTRGPGREQTRRKRSSSSARRVTGVLSAVLLAGTATVVLAVPAHAAAAHDLYAYATGTGTALGCPASLDDQDAGCSLGQALDQAAAGDTIVLDTDGNAGVYVGNWRVSTPGTSPAKPLTIRAAPPADDRSGEPTLSGNDGQATGCTTSSCGSSILYIDGDTSVVVDGVFFENAESNGDGGAIDNGDEHAGGTLTVRDSEFVGNHAGTGGAIANGVEGAGKLVVERSYFFFDQADDGGAIANGVYAASPSLGAVSASVTGSTFTVNEATDTGGAIDTGGATTTVASSYFAGNTTAQRGGALFSGLTLGDSPVDAYSTTVSASTFLQNGASDGGAISSTGSGHITTVGSTFDGDTAKHVSSEITGTATTVVAGDLFAGSCATGAAVWVDDGHNAGVDATCMKKGTGDLVSPAVGSDVVQAADNRGADAMTIAPTATSPVIGIVPNGATAPHAPASVRTLCARTDASGYRTATGSTCDAGAIDLPAPLRPTLSIAGGSRVAVGSRHALAGRTRAGASVVLSQAGTKLATAVAGKTGTYSFTRTIARSDVVTVSADHQSTQLAVTAVRLTLGVSGKQPLRKGQHAITGQAPAHRVVTLLRDGHVFAHTTASSTNRYTFSLRLAATHRYRIDSDGISSSTVSIRVV
jgi:predicted outer membrane repeat protein